MPTPPTGIPAQHPFGANQSHGRPQAVIPYGINRDSGQNDGFPLIAGFDGLLVTFGPSYTPPTPAPFQTENAVTVGFLATSTSQVILAANADRVAFVISNPGPETVSVAFGATALTSGNAGVGAGHKLDPNGSFTFSGYTGDVAIIASDDQYINVTEVTI